MQTYIIGIGQCGSSITLDMIARLTGFTKSKEIASRPQEHGSKAATNELLNKLMSDYQKRNWLGNIADTLKRFFGLDGDPGGAILVDPRFAIIDGNQDNYVKNAFSVFQNQLTNPSDDLTPLQRYLVDLILGAQVLGLGNRDNGCANGIVGEAVVSEELQAGQLRNKLGTNQAGFLLLPNGNGRTGVRVRLFFIVSSAAGGTGSGGSAHLANDAVLDRSQSDRGSLAVNLVVLPNIETSAFNPRYALNAGRFLSRSCGTVFRKGQADQRPFSSVLFSNPSNEGNFRQLQLLNDYMVEFMMRCANFSFLGNVARVGRDMDPTEVVTFMEGKCIVLAMNQLDRSAQDSPDLETDLVKPAFANIFEETMTESNMKARGVSVERHVESPDGDEATVDVLAQCTRALFVVGIPPKFNRSIDLPKIQRLIQKYSGSSLSSGISAYSYGSLEDLEITIMLRFPSLDKNPLARHFVRRYACKSQSDSPRRARPLLEATYVGRASKSEDEDAEAFEEIAQNRSSVVGFADFMLDPRRASQFG